MRGILWSSLKEESNGGGYIIEEAIAMRQIHNRNLGLVFSFCFKLAICCDLVKYYFLGVFSVNLGCCMRQFYGPQWVYVCASGLVYHNIF